MNVCLSAGCVRDAHSRPGSETVMWHLRKQEHLLTVLSYALRYSTNVSVSSGTVATTLTVDHALKHHSGNYTCAVGNLASATVAVHILNGKSAVLNEWLRVRECRCTPCTITTSIDGERRFPSIPAVSALVKEGSVSRWWPSVTSIHGPPCPVLLNIHETDPPPPNSVLYNEGPVTMPRPNCQDSDCYRPAALNLCGTTAPCQQVYG
jgi:hypothetical protein